MGQLWFPWGHMRNRKDCGGLGQKAELYTASPSYFSMSRHFLGLSSSRDNGPIMCTRCAHVYLQNKGNIVLVHEVKWENTYIYFFYFQLSLGGPFRGNQRAVWGPGAGLCPGLFLPATFMKMDSGRFEPSQEILANYWWRQTSQIVSYSALSTY